MHTFFDTKNVCIHVCHQCGMPQWRFVIYTRVRELLLMYVKVCAYNTYVMGSKFKGRNITLLYACMPRVDTGLSLGFTHMSAFTTLTCLHQCGAFENLYEFTRRRTKSRFFPPIPLSNEFMFAQLCLSPVPDSGSRIQESELPCLRSGGRGLHTPACILDRCEFAF